MIKKIKQNIWQICLNGLFEACVYLIKLKDKNILIDTGYKSDKQELIKNLNEIEIKPQEINLLLLTHNHPDHTGNISIFEKAKIYADKKD